MNHFYMPPCVISWSQCEGSASKGGGGAQELGVVATIVVFGGRVRTWEKFCERRKTRAVYMADCVNSD